MIRYWSYHMIQEAFLVHSLLSLPRFVPFSLLQPPVSGLRFLQTPGLSPFLPVLSSSPEHIPIPSLLTCVVLSNASSGASHIPHPPSSIPPLDSPDSYSYPYPPPLLDPISPSRSTALFPLPQTITSDLSEPSGAFAVIVLISLKLTADDDIGSPIQPYSPKTAVAIGLTGPSDL